MHGFPRGKTAIVGAATFGVGKSPGFEAIDLAAHAALRALADAGLRPAAVDALFIAQPHDTLAGLTFSEYLGIRPVVTDNNRSGGSAYSSPSAGLLKSYLLCSSRRLMATEWMSIRSSMDMQRSLRPRV